jgi:hypothetical protein
MGFSFRKFTRALDPTSKTSALGGVVRMGIGALPGGSAALEAVTAVGGVRVKSPTPASNPAGPTPTAANAVPAIAGGSPLVSASNPGTVAILGFAVAGALLVYLLAKK